MTHEGARSVTGPFMALLGANATIVGANATIVGVVAGFGELAGYVLRLPAGYISDRTRGYWTITILGYVINMLVVPLLFLVGKKSQPS